MESTSNAAKWTGRILSLLAALPFLISGALKLTGSAQMTEGFDHFGWPQSAILTVAILEVLSVVLYLIPPFSILGAILLTGYLGGAIATHMRIGEPVYLHVAIGLFIWGGLFLRELRLRTLLPVRGKDCVVKKEILINLPPSAVFTYLKFLRNFQNWNPFLKKDPQAQIKFSGTDGQPGFMLSWSGNREMGSGEQEVTKIIDGQRVEFVLRFKTPYRATNTGYFGVEAVGQGQTKVTWQMVGKTTFPMSLIGLFMNLEKIIGKEFQSGLNQLKGILER